MATPLADSDQMLHVAKLAFLAMSARAVACHEFDTSDEVQEMRFTVSRVPSGECPIDVEFIGTHSIPLGGMSL